jgi:PKD repeat protein
MKSFLILISAIIVNVSSVFSQCSSLFSFAAYFETVTFINQSTTSNAHYYWNFGDGTSSNLQNPTHKFPETGNYLVTLFVKDSVSNCSDYYDYWVNVTKYSTDICQPNVSDSIFLWNGDDYLKISNKSLNCNSYYTTFDGAGASHIYVNNWLGITGFKHGRFVCRIQYTTYDTINGYVIHREGYKSILYNYSSSKNYGNCSANFEFKTVSQDSLGQRILFKAMNKNATFYEWAITGFGNPIYSNNDTISQYYPYQLADIWLVGLRTIGASGCTDTLNQEILVRKGIQTFVGVNEIHDDLNIKIYPNPTASIINISAEQNQLQNATIQIKNNLGQLIFSSPFTSQINLSSLSASMYFLTIEDNSIKKTIKIIKQ